MVRNENEKVKSRPWQAWLPPDLQWRMALWSLFWDKRSTINLWEQGG